MDDSLIEAGGQAVAVVNETANSFIAWAKSFMTWDNLFKIIGIFVILLAIWVIYKIITHSIKKIPAEKLSPQKSMVIMKVLTYAFYIIVIMYILSLFGIKLSAIWGAAGVAGVAVAFAAQTSVSNIISGVFVIAEKALKIGDLITVAGETGIVDNVGLLSVTIHTTDNQMIRIPNSTIINSNLRNTSYFSKRRLNVEVSVSYETDLEYALDVLVTAPKYCKNILKDPAPLTWIDKFDDSGINLTLAVWFESSKFLAVKNESFIAVKRVFDEAEIEIPYNKLDVKICDDNTTPSAKTKKDSAKAKPKIKAPAKKGKIDRNVKIRSKANKEQLEYESSGLKDKDK